MTAGSIGAAVRAGSTGPGAAVALGAAAVVTAAVLSAAAPLGVVLQGAVYGAGTGLMAVGLVLVYRTTRVVNFAYGAMGGLAASVAVAVHDEGQGLSWPAAVLVAVAVGVAVGAAVEVVVVRRFASSSRLLLTVASIGLVQVLGGLQILVPRYLGGPDLVASFSTPFSDLRWDVGPVQFTGNDLVLLAAVPVVLAGLSWFLVRTDAGIAVRGIADNPERARLLGLPVGSLSTLVWGIAGGAAAVAVVLAAPGRGLALDAGAGPLILLPALAAAVVAGFEDMRVAFGAAVALGSVEAVIRWNWPNLSAISTVVLLAAIVVTLLVRRSSGGRRANTAEEWAPGPPTRLAPARDGSPAARSRRLALGAGLAVAALAAPEVLAAGQLNRVTAGLVLGIIAVSLVLLTGWGGSISLGQFALSGVSGLLVANLLVRGDVDLFLSLGAAAAAGSLLALLVGIPGLRLSPLYLAVTTLTVAVVVDAFVINPSNYPYLIPDSLDTVLLWGRFDLADQKPLYFLCLGLLVASVLVVRALGRGRPGRVLVAARDNERAAGAAGVSTVRARLVAFVASGALAGVAGGLQVLLLGGMGQKSFPSETSLLVFSMVVIGGVESLGGALLGVALVHLLTYLFPAYSLVITGSGLLLILLISPRGLVHAGAAARRTLARRPTRPAAAPPPPPPSSSSAPLDGEAFAGVGSPGAPDAVVAEPALLSCHGLIASYGQTPVLFGVDLAVRPGELVALLGTNGAGKSTVLRCLAGLLPPTGGEIRFAGASLVGERPESIARRGIALVPGGRGVFGGLTVAENLRLAAWRAGPDTSPGGSPPRSGGRTSEHAPTGDDPGGVGAVGAVGAVGGTGRPERGRGPRLAPGRAPRGGELRELWVTLRRSTASREASRVAQGRALDAQPALAKRVDVPAGLLSGGEQQMLSLAMAMCVPPEVLCVDELSLGLAPSVVDALLDQVRAIHAAGTTVVVVEQSVDIALRLAERAVFLEKGEVRFTGPTADLAERSDLLRAVFIGGPAEPPPVRVRAPRPDPDGPSSPTGSYPHRHPGPGPEAGTGPVPPVRPILAGHGLTRRYGVVTVVDDVDLEIAPGSIVGLVGHNGAGKTTLFDLLSGFQRPDAGRVVLDGVDVTEATPHLRARGGLGRSFQHAALYRGLTVEQAVLVALDTHLACRDAVAAAFRAPIALDSEAAARTRAAEVLARLGLDRYADRLTSELSTGTRRIVELACTLAQGARVVLLDEPSAGVARAEIENLIGLLRRAQAESGCALVVIEHDMGLISELCDDLVAMELGRILTRGAPADVLSHPEVVASYLGTTEAASS